MPKYIYKYTGSIQTFTLPDPVSVNAIGIKVWGAAGGYSGIFQSKAGAGGYSYGELPITLAQALSVMVGQGGVSTSNVPTFGGGGAGGDSVGTGWFGSSGGGRSGVGFFAQPQFIIAGGGAGDGIGSIGTNLGGNGGGLAGNDEVIVSGAGIASLTPAKGGTQTNGGAGGINAIDPLTNGFAGFALQGGKGGKESTLGASGAGGGGGGGYYGGGGGTGSVGSNPDEQAGGGGSGFIDTNILFNATTSVTPITTVAGIVYPPNISDPDYITGVGVANSPTASRNGLVVFVTPDLILNKTVSENNTTTGRTLNYTISIQNTGPGCVSNILFKDTIPSGTTFINGSLMQDGTLIGSTPNPPGVTLPNGILKNQVSTITFSVLVTATAPNTIKNQAFASYGNGAFPYISNQVVTTVVAAEISSSKIGKTYANIGDILTYTIPIKNTGNTTATNILFIDTIPNGTTFVANSLKQDSTVLTGLSPNPPGATLPNGIKGGSTSVVTFQVKVNTFPSPNPIPNSATQVFQFTVDNSTVPNIVATGSYNTNIVNTTISRADLSNITKIVDKDFATLNDVLTYTITIPNTGNISANSVMFKDTIPTGTTFVPNSFTLNGVVKTGVNPAPPGINIGTIPSNGIFTVTFKVTVTTIPSPSRVLNSSNTTFNYQVDPNVVTTTSGSANSNVVTTTITRIATISPTKLVDVSGAFIGDTLTYTIGLKNTGTTTANNIFFTDTTPNGTDFVVDSIKINGVTISGGTLNPPSGVSIPDLGINQSATLTFKVTVNTIPSPNPTTNIGTASFSYTDTSSGISGTSVNNTNTVSTFIYPDSNPFKTVDKQYATIGDTITYTLGWTNILAVQQTDVVFVDTIPTGTTFVPNSVTVRGVSRPGATVTAPNGINTLTLAAGQLVTVTFKVTINTIPSINPIPNDTTVIYSSTLVAGKQSDVSNIATTQVNYSTLDGFIKNVDKNFTTVGDTLTYTITLANNGNIDVENVVFYDTIPDATSFIDGSFIVNGVTLAGENPNPPTGANIGTIPAGAVTTIMFKVSIDTIPSPNSIPNTASLNGDYILDPILGTTISIGGNTNTVLSKVYFANLINSIKGVDKAFSDVPTTLTYTITIVNSGNTSANNVVFVDTVPDGTNLVLNSVTVNGLPISGASPNPPGVTIGTVPIGATSTVTFKVTVNTIPTINPIPNTGTVGYNFIVDPSLLTTSSGVHNTNTVDTTINHADLGNIMKFTDTQYAQCGDIVTYTISIPNNGNVDALNVVLSDTVPNGTSYVPGSLQVDGNPIGGTPASINVGTIPAQNTSIVTFQVQINC